MALSARLFYDPERRCVVRLGSGESYLCHNTGNRVYIAYIVGNDETYEVFIHDLVMIGPLEAMAIGLDF